MIGGVQFKKKELETIEECLEKIITTGKWKPTIDQRKRCFTGLSKLRKYKKYLTSVGVW